jgi:hypothetical protein
MKNHRRAGLTIALIFAVTMSTSAQQAPAPAAATAHPQSVKVTGCVERATTTVTPAAQASSDVKFLLTMAQLSPAPTPAVTSVAGAPASAARTTPAAVKVETPTTFRLDGDEAMIEPHVGHKVEASGEIVEAIAPAAATPTPAVGGSPVSTAGTPRPVDVTGDGSQVSPRLKVIEIRMIAMTCP